MMTIHGEICCQFGGEEGSWLDFAVNLSVGVYILVEQGESIVPPELSLIFL